MDAKRDRRDWGNDVLNTADVNMVLKRERESNKKEEVIHELFDDEVNYALLVIGVSRLCG